MRFSPSISILNGDFDPTRRSTDGPNAVAVGRKEWISADGGSSVETDRCRGGTDSVRLDAGILS
jgi:hypothetical protein